MDAADAERVVALTDNIRTIQQALFLLDNGAAITSMTLTLPEPPPPAGHPQPPEPEAPETSTEDHGETERAPASDEPAEEPPAESSVGEMSLSTQGLTYPPQMLQAIRAQELEMWKTAYDELAKLGVTNVPQPPGAQAAPQAPPAPAQRAAAPIGRQPRTPVPPRRR